MFSLSTVLKGLHESCSEEFLCSESLLCINGVCACDKDGEFEMEKQICKKSKIEKNQD